MHTLGRPHVSTPFLLAQLQASALLRAAVTEPKKINMFCSSWQSSCLDYHH